MMMERRRNTRTMEIRKIEDENALLDKMLKDRFLHRSSVEMEEEFSDDEEPEEETFGDGEYIIKVGSEFICKTSF